MVRPWPLVSTVPLLVLWVMIVTAEPPLCRFALACPAGAFVIEWLADGAPELPQAAISAAAPAASGVAHHRLRIGHISVLVGRPLSSVITSQPPETFISAGDRASAGRARPATWGTGSQCQHASRRTARSG